MARGTFGACHQVKSTDNRRVLPQYTLDSPTLVKFRMRPTTRLCLKVTPCQDMCSHHSRIQSVLSFLRRQVYRKPPWFTDNQLVLAGFHAAIVSQSQDRAMASDLPHENSGHHDRSRWMSLGSRDRRLCRDIRVHKRGVNRHHQVGQTDSCLRDGPVKCKPQLRLA